MLEKGKSARISRNCSKEGFATNLCSFGGPGSFLSKTSCFSGVLMVFWKEGSLERMGECRCGGRRCHRRPIHSCVLCVACSQCDRPLQMWFGDPACFGDPCSCCICFGALPGLCNVIGLKLDQQNNIVSYPGFLEFGQADDEAHKIRSKCLGKAHAERLSVCQGLLPHSSGTQKLVAWIGLDSDLNPWFL